MPDPKLSPKERKRLEKLVNQNLNMRTLTLRQQVRSILVLLGAKHPEHKVLQAEVMDILQDDRPFKEKRLRKLVNGQ